MPREVLPAGKALPRALRYNSLVPAHGEPIRLLLLLLVAATGCSLLLEGGPRDGGADVDGGDADLVDHGDGSVDGDQEDVADAEATDGEPDGDGGDEEPDGDGDGEDPALRITRITSGAAEGREHPAGTSVRQYDSPCTSTDHVAARVTPKK